MAVMTEQQWQPLPVTDRQGRFVGMLTRASILGALAESAARLGL
jgi:CBS domain-containing protein